MRRGAWKPSFLRLDVTARRPESGGTRDKTQLHPRRTQGVLPFESASEPPDYPRFLLARLLRRQHLQSQNRTSSQRRLKRSHENSGFSRPSLGHALRQLHAARSQNRRRTTQTRVAQREPFETQHLSYQRKFRMRGEMMLQTFNIRKFKEDDLQSVMNINRDTLPENYTDYFFLRPYQR